MRPARKTARPRTTVPTERHKAVAEDLAAGKPIYSTMVSHGYSPAVASTGMQGVPVSALRLVLEKTNPDLVQYLSVNSNADMKDLVLARLKANVSAGRDGGVMSAKALGSIKELSMFQPDSQVGIIVVNAPTLDDVKSLTARDEECE